MVATKKARKTATSTDRATAWARAVVAGDVIAGPHVRNACRRHLDDLERGHERGLHYDAEAAERVCDWFENVLKLSEGQFDGRPFVLHGSQAFKLGNLFGWKRPDGSRRFRRAYIEEGKGNGKALALGTPIPTPGGWTTMGALRSGDEVFDDRGVPCRVVVAHPVSTDRECYEVEFDDGEVIIASAEHLWRTEHRHPKPGGVSIKTTAEIAATLRYANGQHQSANHSVALCGPLSEDRWIVRADRVAPVPVRCITVDAPTSMFLCGRSMVPTHNSPLAGGIGLYGLTADKEAGAQVYAAAAKKDQAAILFQDAVKMVRQSPGLAKRVVTSGGVGREYNLAHISSGSFFRPISKDAGRTGSGPRPHFALCDEVHEHPDRSIMEMLERGFKFRRQPLLLMITNSGSDRNSVCWEEHEHAIKVAAGTREIDDEATYVGEPIDDTTFSFVCSLDKGDDPLEDPSCWVKANPLLGVTITEEYIAGVVRQAKDLPGKLNGILRLHFCVWTDSAQAWMARPTLEAVLGDVDPDEHIGKEVFCGVDLSGSQDMTALACVVETGSVQRERDDGTVAALPTYDAWVEAWTPGDTLSERALRDKAPYDVWVRNGWLHAPSGKQIRLDMVASRIAAIDAEYRIGLLAYDRYAYRKLEAEMQDLGLSVRQIEHPQGGKRRAKVPDEILEECRMNMVEPPLGLWMPGSVAALEALILEGRIRLRRSPVLVSAVMSAATEEDDFANRWFSKLKSTNRIDAVVALAMAVGAAEFSRLRHADHGSVYSADRGILFFG